MSKGLQLFSKVKTIPKGIPVGDILSTVSTLVEINRENKQTKRDIAAIEARTGLLIKEMELKYDLYYKVFGQIFHERKQAIDKSFEIVDKGLKENDKELISMGLGSLSKIVSSSPFSNLSELSNLLNGNNVVEI
jgi:hypothetical protein